MSVYGEKQHPKRALRPADPSARARVREMALSIACDIHPLNNLRVQQYLTSPLNVAEPQRDEWSRHGIALAFAAIEQRLVKGGGTGPYSFGATPTFADCFLIPQ